MRFTPSDCARAVDFDDHAAAAADPLMIWGERDARHLLPGERCRLRATAADVGDLGEGDDGLRGGRGHGGRG